jgi:hypothetical protein
MTLLEIDKLVARTYWACIICLRRQGRLPLCGRDDTKGCPSARDSVHTWCSALGILLRLAGGGSNPLAQRDWRRDRNLREGVFCGGVDPLISDFVAFGLSSD